MAMDTHLALQVVQLLGPEEADTIVLSTGSARFTAAASSGNASADRFLLSPWELSHAEQRPLPAAAAAQQAAAGAGAAAASPAASPVLTVTLSSSKRWGADVVLASGELLLAPYLASLAPNQAGQLVRVPLTKASSKPAKAAAKAGSTAGAPGADAAGAGPDGHALLLELALLSLPPVPPQLLGPAGSGRAEVPPRYAADTAWLTAARPVLHMQAGHLYSPPSVQLVRVTLHKARGLLNLNVDPAAAAAAAAAITRMAAAGSSPSRADRALTAAERVLDSKAGRALFNKTSSWFARSKSSAGAVAAAAAVARTGSVVLRAHSPSPAAGAAGSPSTGGSPVGAAWMAPREGEAGMPRTLSVSSAAAEEASERPPARAGSATELAGSRSGSGSGSAEPGAAGGGGSGSGPQPALVAAADGGTAAAAAGPEPGSGPEAAASDDVDRALDVALDAPSSSGEVGGSSISDPVSRLQRATQHTRSISVDTDAVMAALEDNGFHATDAPGGAFFYVRLALSDGGAAHVSRVVGAPGGEARWEQGFWLPVVRPAPPGAALELELFAARDDKTRGRSVAQAKVPLHQLLAPQPGQPAPSADPAWFASRHVVQASFSDHLHCTFLLTVEAADWDLRAQLAGLPRALPPPAAATSEEPRPAAAAAGSTQLLLSSAAAAPGSEDPAVSEEPVGRAGSAAGSLARSGSEALPPVAPQQQPEPPQEPPSVAMLDLVVKSFDTRKPLDVFFVLLCGSRYCLVSSTSHSTHQHHWGWHLRLPVADPAELLTLALFARDDQAGGRKKVGATMLGMFSSSTRLLAKLRLRLSTLPANVPLNISMPMAGERTNLRAGQPGAAVAHLYLHLCVPQLLRCYLAAYARFAVCSPGLYLLASSPAAAGPDSSLDALASEVQLTTARWLEQQPPCVSGRVYAKAQDDGRAEFTLSRTRANWRRLMMLREAAAPLGAAFRHLCSWESPAHSLGAYAVILLFGAHPSKVLSVVLLLLAVALVRAARLPAKAPTPGAPGAAAAAAATAAAPAVAAAGGGGGWLQRLLPNRPPPPMFDPLLVSAEDALPGSAVPTDPYTSLKQNYEAVIGFLTTVQNVIDGYATAGERLLLAFSWSDQLATAVLLLLMLLLSLGLWLLGLRVLVTAGLLWVFRHPVLRDPLPPPPATFVGRMPTRADTML